MGVLPNEYYYKAIEYIKRILKDPLFYVFSDDLIWAKENLNLEGKTTYVDSGIDYLDLELMSSCSHNIIANSSFSWWGAFLNRNPNKIVIGPKNWVRQPEINKRIELLFPSWVKL